MGRRRGIIAVAAWLLLRAATAEATEVQVLGVTPGRSARLSIDGGVAIKLGIGETVENVTLLRVDREGVTVRVDGDTRTVPLGSTAGSGAPSAAGRGSIILTAGRDGHFIANGMINGRSVKFLVDTGATLTTLSANAATRLGLAYRDAPTSRTMTANGPVRGWMITLPSLTVNGTAVPDVVTMVIDSDLPIGLLGMSFLNHFDLQRQGSTLVLQRR